MDPKNSIIKGLPCNAKFTWPTFSLPKVLPISKILMVLKQILMKTTTNTLNFQQQSPIQPSRRGSGWGGGGGGGRKGLKWFEYIQNGCHGCRHIWGFVTSHSPNYICKTKLWRVFKNFLLLIFVSMFYSSDKQSFPKNKPNLWDV